MNTDRVKYIVDEQNGIVAAEIDACYGDATDKLNELIANTTSGFTVWSNCLRGSKFDMNRKYKAVAHLHPEDKWDEKRGKAIACDKLTEAYHRSQNKRLAKYAADFRKIADNIEKYLNDRHFYDNN